MADYTQQHASALRQMTAKGAAVTFTFLSPGTHDETTDTFTSASTSTVAGYAVRTRGNPLVYQQLNLVQTEAPSLLFCPSTYGQQPALNSTVSWGGVTYTVRAVEPVEPDGNAILNRVVVSR